MQRRVYDALNVLSAMGIIRKEKFHIIYNHHNDHIPIDFDNSDDDGLSEVVSRQLKQADVEEPCS